MFLVVFQLFPYYNYKVHINPRKELPRKKYNLYLKNIPDLGLFLSLHIIYYHSFDDISKYTAKIIEIT